MKKQYLIVTTFAAVVLISSTSRQLRIFETGPLDNDCLELPETPFNYANIALPPHLNTPNIQLADNTPADNPITNAGATLGRVLFYDVKLSQTSTQSCASCHKQANGFSDDSQFSRGFVGGFTARNSMGLAMARFYAPGHFFWNERAATLEEQVLMPIQDPVEMGLTLEELVTKLSATPYYSPLFEAAFGTPEVTTDRIAKAVAQFMRSMVSFNSRYDEGRSMTPPGSPPVVPFPNFTAQENQGKAIFFDPLRGNCAACHGTDAFIAPEARNNGLDLVSVDEGVGGFNGNAAQIGLFKVPSLRNVELSPPYMHDGRFETLEDVVQHYNQGVQAHPNLSPQLRQGGPNGPPRVLNLTTDERAALVAFLKTLTDPVFIQDERWSDPFCSLTNAGTGELQDNAIQLLPNPASGNFQVRMAVEGRYELRLISLSGQPVRNLTFSGDTCDFNTTGIPAGVYYLQIDGTKRAFRKVVLQ